MLCRIYRKELETEGNPNVEETIVKQFASWFKKHVSYYSKILNKTFGFVEVVFILLHIHLYRLQESVSLLKKMSMLIYMLCHVNHICELKYFQHVLLMVFGSTPSIVKKTEKHKIVESWLRAHTMENILTFMVPWKK